MLARRLLVARPMITVESRFYPYLLISFRGTGHEAAEYRAMFDATEAIGRKALRERTRYVCVSITSGGMSASEREIVARMIQEAPKDLQNVAIGTFVVVRSALFRGIVTALRWVSPALANIEPVSSADVAMSNAEAAFRRNGITVGIAETELARRWLQDQAAQHERVEQAAS
jgi:hypothetical protein